MSSFVAIRRDEPVASRSETGTSHVRAGPTYEPGLGFYPTIAPQKRREQPNPITQAGRAAPRPPLIAIRVKVPSNDGVSPPPGRRIVLGER